MNPNKAYKTNEQIACNNWEKIGFLKGKQSAEKELDELQEAFDIALKEISRLRNKLGYDKQAEKKDG